LARPDINLLNTSFYIHSKIVAAATRSAGAAIVKDRRTVVPGWRFPKKKIAPEPSVWSNLGVPVEKSPSKSQFWGPPPTLGSKTPSNLSYI